MTNVSADDVRTGGVIFTGIVPASYVAFKRVNSKVKINCRKHDLFIFNITCSFAYYWRKNCITETNRWSKGCISTYGFHNGVHNGLYHTDTRRSWCRLCRSQNLDTDRKRIHQCLRKTIYMYTCVYFLTEYVYWWCYNKMSIERNM